jgi:hypothetical protein
MLGIMLNGQHFDVYIDIVPCRRYDYCHFVKPSKVDIMTVDIISVDMLGVDKATYVAP